MVPTANVFNILISSGATQRRHDLTLMHIKVRASKMVGDRKIV
jgi:hypothetical protein